MSVRGTSFRRVQSRLPGDRVWMATSSVSSSIEAPNEKDSDKDSVRTDPEFRSKSTDEHALRTIEEETKQADESFHQAPTQRSMSDYNKVLTA